MSRRHPNDVAQWVVFPRGQWEAERNGRSDKMRWLQATQPTSARWLLLGRRSRVAGLRCVVGAVLSRGKGGEAAFQPGGMNIRAAGGNGRPGLLLMLLIGGSSSMDSFGAFHASVSSTTSYLSWMAQAVGEAGTVPGSRSRIHGSCDGGVGATRLRGCTCCWTFGSEGKLPGTTGLLS